MIGIDIISINRVRKFVDKFGDRALKKFLSEDEIKIAKKIETIAGFWSAKEAISKALKSGIGNEIGFLDIKIYKDKKNAPYFELSNRVKEKFNVKETSLSISHDGGFAIAVAVIFLS